MRLKGKKSDTKCVMKSCQNLRYKNELLCYNHWQIKEKLYSFRYEYGDLKNVKK